MKPTKQIVYLPVEIEEDDYPFTTKTVNKEQEGYFFTPKQLNEYTQSVIKQALETAANKAGMKCKKGHSGEFAEHWSINKKSITNTFEETYKKFEV